MVDGLSLAHSRVALRMPRFLFLTARNVLPDRIAGLKAGVDHYMAKPFDLEELSMRLRWRETPLSKAASSCATRISASKTGRRPKFRTTQVS